MSGDHAICVPRRPWHCWRFVAGLAASGLLASVESAYAGADSGFEVLYGFGKPMDGLGVPHGDLIAGEPGSGLFFGVTNAGGRGDNGSVFETDLQGGTKEIHEFKYHECDAPVPPLARAPDGTLFGACYSGGGKTASGTLWRLDPDGSLRLLHRFHGPDGDSPSSGLLLASDGNLYGTTWDGGRRGQGVLYRVSPQGQFEVLHSFGASFDSGCETPLGQLMQAANGDIIGPLNSGGRNDAGCIYAYSPDGRIDIIAKFDVREHSSGPAFPAAGLVDGGDGWWYGTSVGGGSRHGGTVYRMNSQRVVQVLHSFTGSAFDGSAPMGRLAPGSDGGFYGTTPQGGANDEGALYRIDANGVFTLLHSFAADGGQGAGPTEALLEAQPGWFIGAAPRAGPRLQGDIYAWHASAGR